MGNPLSTFAEKQKEMQQNMIQTQQRNMEMNVQKQRRIMLATQIAVTKDRLRWMEAFGAVAALGLTVFTIKKGFPKPAIIPITFYGFLYGYQYDLVYGTKAQRILQDSEDLISNPEWCPTTYNPPSNALNKNTPK
eukprot:TRINITY_DN7437_c0_g5_i5.p1 TRINITY_DN7437_c0_g5~~TRINITY_DN7437_c0_g5_i5.p1  ORF type:complete len:135 (-),score=23.34 TRINITY_DN7437_c0_g5_i5:47-451(-)